MNLYKINRTDDCAYDEFDSAVVVAETEEQARNMDPGDGEPMKWGERWSTWCDSPDKVEVTFLAELPYMPDYTVLGKDKYGDKSLVVCASFNAG